MPLCLSRLSNGNAVVHMDDMLWLACVGITNAHVHHWLDVAGYSTLALELRNQVQTMFPPPSANLNYAAGGASSSSSSSSAYHVLKSAIYAEDLDSSLLERPPPSRGMDRLDHPIRTRIALSEHGRILAEPKFHFFLLHHQFLWDATVYLEFCGQNCNCPWCAGCTACRNCWRSWGFHLKIVNNLLYESTPQAPIGSANLCPTIWIASHGLYQLFCSMGYQSLLSATNMPYTVMALLENMIKFLEDKNNVCL